MKDKSALRIVYMGTPEFAVEPLKQLLLDNYNVVAVVTAIDKPAGRGYKLSYSAVKEFALTKNIPVLQPESLKDETFLGELASYRADLQIVVAFRMLPKVVWNMPIKGTFNLHASLLPQYRGAAPINWAIINGDKETGVTTFFIEEQIDTGNILFQEKTNIDEDDNVGSLYQKLMTIGAQLVIKTTAAILSNTIKPIPQSQIIIDELRPAPKITKETCRIDWNSDSEDIHNQIRGFSPYPGAWTTLVTLDNKINVKIFSTTFETVAQFANPGTILSDSKHYMKVATFDGYVYINEIQPAGKSKMDVASFLNGHKISDGALFE